MEALGWISIHRKLKEHWLWQNPVKLKWWLDILLSVNHTDVKVNIGYQLFDCKRGQSIKSLQGWGESWGVTKDSARNFLRLLEKDGMITLENLSKTTRLTVCKYDSYQTVLHAEPTQAKRKPNAEPTQPLANNNENKDNKENKGIDNILFGLDEGEIEIWETYTAWYQEQKFQQVTKIQNQLEPKQLLKLLETYNAEDIKETLLNLENYKQAKNYASVYLTLNKWLKKQFA